MGAGEGEAARLPAEYVLPLRWEDDRGLAELTAYLDAIGRWIDVTVVDGSPDPLFAAHRRAWPAVRHVPPSVPGRNGKARGALTGISVSRHEIVIVADDDVRYRRSQVEAVLDRLAHADFVRPQNVFRPRPWHARWDTGRMLLNRAAGGDFAGTVALRRSALRSAGYDTDVLFENLELERTVRARGGRVTVARDIVVVRCPPSVERFWEQRVRQAYDDFAQPLRLIREAAVLPLVVVAIARRRVGVPAVLALGSVAVAAVGRSRAGGRAHFTMSDCLWAPVWLAERAVTVWIAIGARLRGGVRYRDARLARAANSLRALRRRAATAPTGARQA
jgi:hypothetical protein